MKKYSPILFCIILFFATSCGRQYYAPKPLDPPLLKENHDLKVNMNFVLGTNGLTTISMAGSPADHLGLQAAITTGGHERTDTGKTVRQEYLSTAFSAGVYSLRKEEFLLELYAGAGGYRFKNEGDAFIKDLRYNNFFIQPSIAMVRKKAELAFTLRYDLLKRKKLVTDINFAPQAGVKEFDFLQYDTYSFLQPGFVFRFGGKAVQFQTQVSRSFALNEQYASVYGPHDYSGKMQIAIGIGLKVHYLFKKQTGSAR